MNRTLDVLTSYGVSSVRLAAGLSVGRLGPRPGTPLILYEMEGCPFCRKVREAMTMLDLEAEIRPCPKGGRRFREQVQAKGGKQQFPYMEDPNTGAAMYESDDIIAYLFKHYGEGKPPALLWSAPATLISGALAGLLRPDSSRYVAARVPEKPLELYSFEGSPFCRIAREALCQLELPYLLHNVGKNSPRRPAFVAISGKMMVPYLVDPNTGTGMFESADIKAYLTKTYVMN